MAIHFPRGDAVYGKIKTEPSSSQFVFRLQVLAREGTEETHPKHIVFDCYTPVRLRMKNIMQTHACFNSESEFHPNRTRRQPSRQDLLDLKLHPPPGTVSRQQDLRIERNKVLNRISDFGFISIG